mmetsp:Transcript_1690/g.10383  ORF Transcript_1690/g.10383 Transcript_1690/m.10383 type:complete len:233 (-) Transcript_1690:2199-2897(-)
MEKGRPVRHNRHWHTSMDTFSAGKDKIQACQEEETRSPWSCSQKYPEETCSNTSHALQDSCTSITDPKRWNRWCEKSPPTGSHRSAESSSSCQSVGSPSLLRCHQRALYRLLFRRTWIVSLNCFCNHRVDPVGRLLLSTRPICTRPSRESWIICGQYGSWHCLANHSLWLHPPPIFAVKQWPPSSVSFHPCRTSGRYDHTSPSMTPIFTLYETRSAKDAFPVECSESRIWWY